MKIQIAIYMLAILYPTSAQEAPSYGELGDRSASVQKESDKPFPDKEGVRAPREETDNENSYEVFRSGSDAQWIGNPCFKFPKLPVCAKVI